MRTTDFETSTHVVYGNMRFALMYAKEWEQVPPAEQDALKRVLFCIAKVASGHPDHAGSWGDIKKLATEWLAANIKV